MVRHTRLHSFLLALAASTWLLALTATPAAAASDSPVCSVATSLTEAHQPQKALALIAARGMTRRYRRSVARKSPPPQ